MSNPTSDWFATSLKGRLDESIRVDREESTQDRLQLLKDFHLTDAAQTFLHDLFARIAGNSEGQRRGYNHWLYGYYGSGKSHLLSIAGQLVDSSWIGDVGRETVWEALATDKNEYPELRRQWDDALNRYHVCPLLINLLREQGNAGRGFGNVLIRAVHQAQGLSPEPQVAFFEKWFLSSHSKEELASRVLPILSRVGVNPEGDDPWYLVQQYEAVANVVLGPLFKEETGGINGLSDVTERELSPEMVIQAMEGWRQELAEEKGQEVLIALLLDEVSLFIGTRYSLLTELNVLAERIDEIGDGRILGVATAQEDLSAVRTDYVGRDVDFSILDDRFPHKYSLPSGHVGEIVKNRLLRKTSEGRAAVKQYLQDADLKADTSFNFYDVKRNTSPRLDQIDADQVADYFPLLPYHPPLFLEILAQLRNKKADRAKSIFSGTARAILAIVKGLLDLWQDPEGKGGNPTRLVSLLDFFDIIRPELEDIIPQELQTIKQIEERIGTGSDSLTTFDLDVCKAVLLLQQVPDMISLGSGKNVATALMDDLNGKPHSAQINAVEASLERLDKYIRRDEDAESNLRFTTRDERILLEAAEEFEKSHQWADVAAQLARPLPGGLSTETASLWERVLEELSLPTAVPFRDSANRYEAKYRFVIDQHTIDRTFGPDGAFVIPVHVKGLLEDSPWTTHHTAVLWEVAKEGRNGIRHDLAQWAALAAACETVDAPETIQKQLQRRSDSLLPQIVAFIQEGKIRVRSHACANVGEGAATYVEVNYPKHFHPEMLVLTMSDVRSLRSVRRKEQLPTWAKTIQVPFDGDWSGEIVSKVRSWAGRHIKKKGAVPMADLLQHLTAKESLYARCKPAIAAIMWGFCQYGTFQPVDEDGQPVDANDFLNEHQWHELRLRLGPTDSLRPLLERLPFVAETHTSNQAIVELKNHIVKLRAQFEDLRTEIQTANDNAIAVPVRTLLRAYQDILQERIKALSENRSALNNPQPDWRNIVEGFLGDEQWFSDVKSCWRQRQAQVLHMDALLALPKQHQDVLSAAVVSSIASLEEEMMGAQALPWWTSDGWQQFDEQLKHYPAAVAALEEWWKQGLASADRGSLLESLRAHPWLQTVQEFSATKLGDRFRKDYLDPLRGYLRTIQRAGQVVKPLIQDVSSLDEQAIKRTLGHLADGTPIALPSAEIVAKLQDTLQALNTLTDQKGPAEIATIGHWPDDRGVLIDHLQTIARTEEDPLVASLEHVTLIETSS